MNAAFDQDNNVGDVAIEGDAPEPTFFCRARYDFQSPDDSCLSFRANDIIEVLVCDDSGWWDVLLSGERGWIPSNYVEVITDAEAEAALAVTVPAQDPLDQMLSVVDV